MPLFPTQNLKEWFLLHQRDLPWRENPSPYRVWVSEMMLQQTRVSVVIPYFLRWMEQFPTISSLAAAPLDLVMKMWEGLGYYARARNLHKGAQKIVQEYYGHLPKTEKNLQQIPGLGPYTIGAIRSFSFHQKTAAVDGNVVRVLSRFFGIADNIQKTTTKRSIWTYAEQLLPNKEPWIVNEALIELGAVVCKKKPDCSQCPLQRQCYAYANGKTTTLPYTAKTSQIEKLYRAVAILVHRDEILIRRVQEGEIMAHLHEFPYYPSSKKGLSEQQLRQEIYNHFGMAAEKERDLPPIRHSFTRYQALLQPTVFRVHKKMPTKEYGWIPLYSVAQRAFSSGHRRVLHHYLDSSPIA